MAVCTLGELRGSLLQSYVDGTDDQQLMLERAGAPLYPRLELGRAPAASVVRAPWWTRAVELAKRLVSPGATTAADPSWISHVHPSLVALHPRMHVVAAALPSPPASAAEDAVDAAGSCTVHFFNVATGSASADPFTLSHDFQRDAACLAWRPHEAATLAVGCRCGAASRSGPVRARA